MMYLRISDRLNYLSSYQGMQIILFAIGMLLLVHGVELDAHARTINFNDHGVKEATNAVLTYLEGSFGALVMVCAGVGAILSSAFGQYRAALGLMVVSIGAFILRSLMSTFFNDQGIMS
jgi:uncharacterized membrane protein